MAKTEVWLGKAVKVPTQAWLSEPAGMGELLSHHSHAAPA